MPRNVLQKILKRRQLGKPCILRHRYLPPPTFHQSGQRRQLAGLWVLLSFPAAKRYSTASTVLQRLIYIEPPPLGRRLVGWLVGIDNGSRKRRSSRQYKIRTSSSRKEKTISRAATQERIEEKEGTIKKRKRRTDCKNELGEQRRRQSGVCRSFHFCGRENEPM
jgi:hypothetical protein